MKQSKSLLLRLRAAFAVLGAGVLALGATTSLYAQNQGYWYSVDVGTPTFAGFCVTNADNSIDVVGGGNDIWNDSDNFHYYYAWAPGTNWDAYVQVNALVGPDWWSKCELMVRMSDPSVGPQGPDPFIGNMATQPSTALTQAYPLSGPNAGSITGVAGDNVVNDQWRAAWDQEADWTEPVIMPAPVYPNVWTKISRRGSVFTLYYSQDGANWQQTFTVDTSEPSSVSGVIGHDSSMKWPGVAWPNVVALGIAVTAHNDPTTAAEPGPDADGNILNLTVNFPPITVTTLGVSVQPQSQVAAVGSTASFTVSSTNNANFNIFTWPNWIAYQWYLNGQAVAGATGSAFGYLVPAGDTGDQVWCTASVLPPYNGPNTVNVQSEVAKVSISGVAIAPVWTGVNLGAPQYLGSVVTNSAGPPQVLAITGGGGDIWNNADQCFFYYEWAFGSQWTAIVQVQGLNGVDDWTKCELMVRNSSPTAGPQAPDPFIALMSTSPNFENFIGAQYRYAYDSGCGGDGTFTEYLPEWLKITRNGSQFAMFTSPDGVTWNYYETVDTANISGYSGAGAYPWAVTLGIAVTAHNNGDPLMSTATVSGLATTASGIVPPTTLGFSVQPQSLTVPVDGNAAFTVATTNNATPNILNQANWIGYQWYKNGQEVAGATGTAYNYYVAAGDTGDQVWCTASVLPPFNTIVSAPVQSATAQVTVSGTAITAWHGVNLGAPEYLGSVVTNSAGPPQVLAITGGGGDIWNNADQCYFYYTWASGQQWDAYVQVQGLSGVDDWTKCELMVRNSSPAVGPQAADQFVALMSTSPNFENFIGAQYRPDYGGGCGGDRTFGETFPEWLKISRNGSKFAMSTSFDGVNWTPYETVDTATTTYSSAPYNNVVTVGVAVTAHDNTDPLMSTATVSGLTATFAGILPPSAVGFSVQPQSQQVAVDQVASFTAAATNNAVPNILTWPDWITYQWYKNGQAVSGATGTAYQYLVPPGATLDQVWCTCTVLPPYNTVVTTVQSAIAQVTVSGTAYTAWRGVNVGVPLYLGSVVTNSAGPPQVLAITGGGGDIWNNADQCYFYYTWATGQQWDAYVQVQGLSGVDDWTKCELMVRNSSPTVGPQGPDPFIALMSTSPNFENEIGAQYRPAYGGGCGNDATFGETLPEWLRVSRNGSQFAMYTSSDGVNWNYYETVDTALPGYSSTPSGTGSPYPNTVAVGIAVTAHDNTDPAMSTATVSGLAVDFSGILPPTVLGFSVQPQSSQTVAVGDNVSFTVATTNNATPNVLSWPQWIAYQWYKNGQPVAGATGSAYNYLVPAGDTGDQVWCTASVLPPYNTTVSAPVSSAIATVTISGTAYTVWNGVNLGAPEYLGSVITNSAGPPQVLAITGGGGDIWNNADQCYFYYAWATGQMWDAYVQVQGLSGVDDWTKCELMVRNSSFTVGPQGPDPFIALMSTSPNFENFIGAQYRPAYGGGCGGDWTYGETLPEWLRISRNGSQFAMYTSFDGVNWTEYEVVDSANTGYSSAGAYPATVCVGIAVTAHDNGDALMSTATVAGLASTFSGILPPTIVGAQVQVPTTLSASVGSLASLTFVTTNNANPQVLNYPPLLTYQWYRNGVAIAGATSTTYTWLLQQSDKNAQYYCTARFEPPLNVNFPAGVPSATCTVTLIAPSLVYSAIWTNKNLPTPVTYVDLSFSGAIDPTALLNLGNYSFTCPGITVNAVTINTNIPPAPLLPYDYYKGVELAISGTLTPGCQVVVNNMNGFGGGLPVPSPSSAPIHTVPLTCQDIGVAGDPAVPTTMYADGASAYTVQCEGSDIWNTADGFNFLWEEKTGDFDVVVRGIDTTHTSNWSKAGLMARETLDPASRDWNVVNDPDASDGIMAPDGSGYGANTIECNCRPTYGGGSQGWQSVYNQVPPPYPNAWLRLKRTGSDPVKGGGVFSAYRSTDGINWTQIGSDNTVALNNPGGNTPFAAQCYIGICTTAHNNDSIPLPTPLVYLDTADYASYDSSYGAAVTLTVAYVNGQVVITWNPAVGTLQQSPALGANEAWTDLPDATSPYATTVPASGQVMFYRVRNN